MDQYKEKLKLGVRNLRMIFAKRKIRALEQEIQLLQGSIEMFQIERDQSFHLMDELRLSLQSSVRENKQMREKLQGLSDGSREITNGKCEELRDAMQLIIDRTSYHTLQPLKQINDVNEIACKVLWRVRS